MGDSGVNEKEMEMFKIEGTKVLELVTSVHLDNRTKFQKWILVGSFNTPCEARKFKEMFEAMEG